jgi:hypothetical protein
VAHTNRILAQAGFSDNSGTVPKIPSCGGTLVRYERQCNTNFGRTPPEVVAGGRIVRFPAAVTPSAGVALEEREAVANYGIFIVLREF